MMNDLASYKITDVLLTAAQIHERVGHIARQISADYENTTPIIVTILKGGVIFLADLIRKLTIPHTIEFMAVESYTGTSSKGSIRLLYDLKYEIKDKDIIILEDILDTGLTLDYLYKHLSYRNPRSIKICALLIKDIERECTIKVDYSGFNIPNKFVVGYGLDYNGYYRNLPHIAILGQEE
jgi:hypoxanthine phosphoribosyltransferase